MNIESLRAYCLSKPEAEETFPFDENTPVYKVGGKIFLITGFEYNPCQFNIKCDPELAIDLRERYPCVTPGFHMNKTHWNTIVCDGSVPDKVLREWIDHSYELIRNSLPKKRAAKKKTGKHPR